MIAYLGLARSASRLRSHRLRGSTRSWTSVTLESGYQARQRPSRDADKAKWLRPVAPTCHPSHGQQTTSPLGERQIVLSRGR